MKVDVIMPQMGESIQEGTVVRWLKKIGDSVKRDEPILEISTDKVDAEIPSPAAGVLSEITVEEGKTVEIKTVLGKVETEAGAASAKPPEAKQEKQQEEKEEKPADRGAAKQAAAPAAEKPAPAATPKQESRPASPPPEPRPQADGAEGSKTRSSPLVRRMAQEHDVDVASIAGTGIAGRVTKKDIEAHLTARGGEHAGAKSASAPAAAAGARERAEPLSVMRRKIAEHMVASKRTSAHVHSFFEVDYSAVDRIRREKKDRFFEQHGVKLTYLPFILLATVEALKAWPVVNATVDGDNLITKKDINLGVAVALDWGLIVPVIRNAEEKNLAGLARATADLAERARAKKLLPEEVQGGTFTITNPGVFGSLFGTPIINQPQLAILGVGAIERRLKVIEDSIAIRTLGYLSIGFDHRIIDGAVADQFTAHIKKTLESFDPQLV
ncbi:MAG TPA: dihydrolipoamide acetyltransferase family protein [Candidatus Polarisedimenticolia bacterium]|jgi:2-oxoglutarate dehydrogenase E2 component (dihydrolipoamide succinyltransferase)|nr:dihydrolipoamide acetyltransferase family protein [Candidatus Polarisedimenticolia bacterium]